MTTPLLESVQPSSSTNAIAPMPPDIAAFISVIERASTDESIDVGKLEKLLEMYERVMARNAEMAFNSAFADMQSQMPVITEKGEIRIHDKVQSRYARFEDINDTVKPILKEYGFAITFKTKTTESGITVTAILMHKQGHREDTEMTLMADTSGSKNAVQGVGSSVSYAKRYGLLALLNITTRGEDDDGQAGGAKTITEEQVMELQSLLTKYKVNQGEFLAYFKIPNLTRLPALKFTDAIAALNKKYGPKNDDAKEKGGK